MECLEQQTTKEATEMAEGLRLLEEVWGQHGWPVERPIVFARKKPMAKWLFVHDLNA